MTDENMHLVIGRAEALVLFEMLADLYNQPRLNIGSLAERIALIRLQGALEKTLVEPFMPEYKTLVEEARSHLSTQSGIDCP